MKRKLVCLVTAVLGVGLLSQPAGATGVSEFHEVCPYTVEASYSPPLGINFQTSQPVSFTYDTAACVFGGVSASDASIWPPSIGHSGNVYLPPYCCYTVNTTYSGSILFANATRGYFSSVPVILVGGTVLLGFPPGGSGTSAWSELAVLEGVTHAPLLWGPGTTLFENASAG